jgi:uncharacterized protein (UPF0332 family)
LAFRPIEFLDLSKKLVNDMGTAEVVLRTAICRAYYASFLSARAKVPLNILASVVTKISDSHWAVRVGMKRMGHPEIADKLQALASLRHDSDYEMGVVVTKDNYDTSISLAEDILNRIGGLS